MERVQQVEVAPRADQFCVEHGKVKGTDESTQPQEEGRGWLCFPILTRTIREALGRCSRLSMSFTVCELKVNAITGLLDHLNKSLGN